MITALGLSSEPVIKLFHALQDYGAYVVADSAWNSTSIAMQKGVELEFEEIYGFPFEQNDHTCIKPAVCLFLSDLWKVYEKLHVVDNNLNSSIGGGGDPRVTRAPPLNDTTLCPKNHPQQLKTDDEDHSASEDDCSEVSTFGAKGDFLTNDTAAIQSAIDACSSRKQTLVIGG